MFLSEQTTQKCGTYVQISDMKTTGVNNNINTVLKSQAYKLI